MSEIVAEKVLEEGNIARVKSWPSDMHRDINGNRRELNKIQYTSDDGLSWRNFPPYCWKYTKDQIMDFTIRFIL